jgi:hypothetical protein
MCRGVTLCLHNFILRCSTRSCFLVGAGVHVIRVLYRRHIDTVSLMVVDSTTINLTRIHTRTLSLSLSLYFFFFLGLALTFLPSDLLGFDLSKQTVAFPMFLQMSEPLLDGLGFPPTALPPLNFCPSFVLDVLVPFGSLFLSTRICRNGFFFLAFGIYTIT